MLIASTPCFDPFGGVAGLSLPEHRPKLIKTKMNEMMEYNKYANNDWQTNQIQTYPPKNSHKVYSESKDIEKRFAAQ